jgi:hypothetical protein
MPSGSRSVTPPSYPTARIAASRICEHFTRHLSAARHGGGSAAQAVNSAAIEAMIEAAFWASLRREEGYMPRISLALVAPEAVPWPLTFGRRLPLAAEPLTRLGPAVERPGIHLGVWRDDGQFFVWGATRGLPPFCLVLEVVAPGLLVVKHSRGDEAEKFINIAVLQGDQIKLIDEDSSRFPDCPELLSSLLRLDIQNPFSESMSTAIQLAISMRAHERGGSLLVVPRGSDSWRESITQPVLYNVVPPFSGLADIVRRRTAGLHDRDSADELRRAVDVVAGLTAVDGATVMTDAYEVLAFGAKIVRRRGSQPVATVNVTEPVEGAHPQVIDPGQLGGTRHLSAAQFVKDQRRAVALIASQDGRFTVFAWSPCEKMVHAHRIEALLL